MNSYLTINPNIPTTPESTADNGTNFYLVTLSNGEVRRISIPVDED